MPPRIYPVGELSSKSAIDHCATLKVSHQHVSARLQQWWNTQDRVSRAHVGVLHAKRPFIDERKGSEHDYI